MAVRLLILLALAATLAGCANYTPRQKADYQDFEGRRHEMEWNLRY